MLLYQQPGASGLECPAILIKTLTNLIALDPRDNPLAQATVPRDDPASYLTSTGFAQSLIL